MITTIRHPKWAISALAAGVSLYLAIAVSSVWQFTTDDAYITLRYSENLANGNGLSWNPGQALEGYSNFLYVLLGAAGIHAGIDAILLLKSISVTALLFTGVSIHQLARLWLRPLPAMIPVTITLIYSGTVWWSVSGLETGLYQSLCALVLLLLLKGLGFRPDRMRGPLRFGLLAVAGAVCMIASLTRFEGPIIAVAAVGGILLEPFLHPAESRRAAFRQSGVAAAAFAIPFVALYAPYSMFRLATFGKLLPNSVVCKGVFRSAQPSLIWGAWVFLPLIMAAILGIHRYRDSKTLILMLLCLAYFAVLATVDPVLGYRNRYFLPALGPLAVLAIAGIYSSLPRWSAALGFLFVALSTGVCAASLPVLAQHAAAYADRQAKRERMALWMRDKITDGDVVAAGDIGIFGYTLRGEIFDLFCLNAPEFADPPLNGDIALVANEVLRRRPRFVILTSKDPTALRPWDAYGIYAAIAEHGDFSERYSRVASFANAGDPFNYLVYERRHGLRSRAVNRRPVPPK